MVDVSVLWSKMLLQRLFSSNKNTMKKKSNGSSEYLDICYCISAMKIYLNCLLVFSHNPRLRKCILKVLLLSFLDLLSLSYLTLSFSYIWSYGHGRDHTVYCVECLARRRKWMKLIYLKTMLPLVSSGWGAGDWYKKQLFTPLQRVEFIFGCVKTQQSSFQCTLLNTEIPYALWEALRLT